MVLTIEYVAPVDMLPLFVMVELLVLARLVVVHVAPLLFVRVRLVRLVSDGRVRDELLVIWKPEILVRFAALNVPPLLIVREAFAVVEAEVEARVIVIPEGMTYLA